MYRQASQMYAHLEAKPANGSVLPETPDASSARPTYRIKIRHTSRNVQKPPHPPAEADETP